MSADAGSAPGPSVSPTTAPVESGRFRSTGLTVEASLAGDLQANPVEIRFEQEDGRLTMIAGGPIDATNVPVRITSSTFLPDTDDIAVTAAGCAGDSPTCTVDHWLSGFVGRTLTYRVDGTRLRLTDGEVSLLLERH